MDEQQLRADAERILQRLGPLTTAELSRHLVEEGHDAAADARFLYHLLLTEGYADDLDRTPDDLDDDLGDDLDDERAVFSAYPLAGGRLADLDHLIEGLVVTHRITDDERQAGEVDATPDLTAAHILAPDGHHIPLADGGDLTFTSDGAFVGPAGWLPDEPVLVMTFRDGAIEVAGTDGVPPPDQEIADRLAAAYDVLAGDDAAFREVPELLVEARARYPKLLAEPHAPLTDLLELAGLQLHGEQLHRAGEPPTERAPLADELTDHLRYDHGFDDHEVADLLQVTNAALLATNAVLRQTADLVDEFAADPDQLRTALEEVEGVLDDVIDREAPEALVRLLDRMPSANAVLHDVVGTDGLVAASVLGMLEVVAGDLDDRRARANAHWLRARLLEFLADDHTEAERELRRALDADRDHGEAIFDLTRYRSDRGEAGAALGLLRQLEGGGDPSWAFMLEHFAEPGPTSAGRNDPCPCGSGRKHKVCCGPRNGWPLDDRWPWIWDKVWRNGLMAHAFALLEEVADAAGADVDDEPMSDPVVSNLVTFEAGLIERFVATRGALLPADELELLRELAEVRARVCEIVEVQPGTSLEVLDLRKGERLSLVDVSMSQRAEVGDVFLLWIVPTPDGLRPWEGGIVVPSGSVEHLLDLLDDDPDDPFEVAEWYAHLQAPPRLSNTEGEPMVLTTLRIAVPDVDAAWEALATRLEDEDDQLAEYLEDEGGQRWLRGTVELDGDELVVQANSTARAERLHDLIDELIPHAELVDAERIPADELMRRARMDEDFDGPSSDDAPSGAIDLDSLDEDDRAALDEQLDWLMAEQEDRWLDTSIPALGGATPREAAADPTRRGDLDRLLREMQTTAAAWEGPGRGMDAARVRRELGMDADPDG